MADDLGEDRLEQSIDHGLSPLGGPVNRHDQIAAILSDAIVSGRLAPGSLHSVRAIAEQLGVSRTPVREALLQLARDGSIRFERNRGVRIIQTTEHDLQEIFEIREWLEVPAAARAAKFMTSAQRKALEQAFEHMKASVAAEDEYGLWRHDRAFHSVVLQASGNSRLAQYVDSLRELVLMRDATTTRKGRSPQAVVAEHEPIMEALSAGDPEGAAEAMRVHIRHTRELLLP
ncbi:MAG: GntR family transcriptional regulator [Actinobacteria bacterium]|nr:GntR family transcriptional regulator [Actinomycetota bacterium]